jgi:hypothetical protein
MVCSLIGLALVAGMLIAVRDKLISEDRGLMRGLSLVMLVGLLFVNLAVLFVLPWQAAAAVWAGSGLLIIWLSLRLQLRASFLFGLLLQVVGGIAFLAASPLLLGYLPSEGLRPLAHAGFWAPLVLALAAQVGAWRLRHVLLRQQAGNLRRRRAAGRRAADSGCAQRGAVERAGRAPALAVAGTAVQPAGAGRPGNSAAPW